MKNRHVTFNPIQKAREFLRKHPMGGLLEQPLAALLTSVFKLGKTEGRKSQIENQKKLGRNQSWPL